MTNPNRLTRIGIAAPSAVVRAGLEALLSGIPGLEVTGSFADASNLDAAPLDVLVAISDQAIIERGGGIALPEVYKADQVPEIGRAHV